MENAAKALIIAGGVLITIIIITIGIYLIGSFGRTTSGYVEQLDATALRQYNTEFEVFIGREDIAAQEIITIINKVQQNEQDVNVIIDNQQDCITWDEQHKNDFLQNNIVITNQDGSIQNLYSCESVSYDSETGRVNEIKFKKNRP